MVAIIISAIVCTDMADGNYAVALMCIEFDSMPTNDQLLCACLEYTAPIGELLDYDVVDVEIGQ